MAFIHYMSTYQNTSALYVIYERTNARGLHSGFVITSIIQYIQR